MAKSTPTTAKDTTKSLEDLQREILAVDLETKTLNLAEAKQRNADYIEREHRRHESNSRRQSEISEMRRNMRSIQMSCAHLSGGEATANPTEGGGKFSFSVLTRAIMPDGKHNFIQCPRCRMGLMGRQRTPVEEAKLKKAAQLCQVDYPENYRDRKEYQAWEDHERWKELMKVSRKEGIPHNEIRGPTFNFQDSQGVNFIPDLR